MPLRADLLVRLNAVETDAAAVAGSAEWRPKIEHLMQLTSGSGANQASLIHISERTLAASASEDIDFNGVLDSPLQINMAMVEVVAIIVIAAAANTNDVVIGGTAATQFVGPFGAATHTIKVTPGGVFLIAGAGTSGIGPSAAGSTDLLKIANSGAGSAVDYTLAVIGRNL